MFCKVKLYLKWIVTRLDVSFYWKYGRSEFVRDWNTASKRNGTSACRAVPERVYMTNCKSTWSWRKFMKVERQARDSLPFFGVGFGNLSQRSEPLFWHLMSSFFLFILFVIKTLELRWRSAPWSPIKFCTSTSWMSSAQLVHIQYCRQRRDFAPWQHDRSLSFLVPRIFIWKSSFNLLTGVGEAKDDVKDGLNTDDHYTAFW